MKMQKQQHILNKRLVDLITLNKFYDDYLTNADVDDLDAWISRHYEALQMITLSDIVDLVVKYEQHLEERS